MHVKELMRWCCIHHVHEIRRKSCHGKAIEDWLVLELVDHMSAMGTHATPEIPIVDTNKRVDIRAIYEREGLYFTEVKVEHPVHQGIFGGKSINNALVEDLTKLCMYTKTADDHLLLLVLALHTNTIKTLKASCDEAGMSYDFLQAYNPGDSQRPVAAFIFSNAWLQHFQDRLAGKVK